QYDYLVGRGHLSGRTEPEIDAAIRNFERALALDSTFAPAHSGLADAYLLMAEWGYRPSQEMVPMAESEARKAIDLDESLAEAHTSLASVLQDLEWDWPGAERHFLRAISLNPSYVQAHHWY